LLVSGGGELGARRLLGTARRLAASSRLLAGSVTDEGASVLKLTNGSTVRCVSASEHAVRGWSADALLVDECQLVADDLLLSAALPTTIARPHAFTVLAGTAGRAEGAFFDIASRAEVGDAPTRFSRRVSRLVGGDDPAPWLSPSALAQLETAMGPARADAEMRCVWSTGGEYLFGHAELDAITADYLAPGLSGLSGPASVAAGLDLATTRDRAALVAIGRIPADADHPVFAVRAAHRWPQRAPLFADGGGVLAEVADLAVPLDWLAVDASGLGGGFVQALTPLIRRRPRAFGGGEPAPRFVVIEEMFDGTSRTMAHDGHGQLVPFRAPRREDHHRATRLDGVPFSAPMKAATTGALQSLIQRRALVLPASATDLRRELLGVRVGLTGRGAETFEAQSGGYDDLFDALLLALGPYRDRAGHWRAQVGDLAERRSTPGRWSGVDALTGCGLRLPARPCWLGVRGEDHAPSEDERPRSELVAAVVARLNDDDNGGNE